MLLVHSAVHDLNLGEVVVREPTRLQVHDPTMFPVFRDPGGGLDLCPDAEQNAWPNVCTRVGRSERHMNPSVEQTRSLSRILRTLGSSADRDARARRRFTRRPVNVRVVLDGKVTAEGWALNLSAGGIRVMHEDALCVGDMLRVRIDGSDGLNGDGLELAGVGRVVWVKKCSDGFVSGIEFVEPM